MGAAILEDSTSTPCAVPNSPEHAERPASPNKNGDSDAQRAVGGGPDMFQFNSSIVSLPG